MNELIAALAARLLARGVGSHWFRARSEMGQEHSLVEMLTDDEVFLIADRDARFVAALREIVSANISCRNAVAMLRDEHEHVYGRPCEPEPGVKPDSKTYEEWMREREGGKA